MGTFAQRAKIDLRTQIKAPCRSRRYEMVLSWMIYVNAFMMPTHAQTHEAAAKNTTMLSCDGSANAGNELVSEAWLCSVPLALDESDRCPCLRWDSPSGLRENCSNFTSCLCVQGGTWEQKGVAVPLLEGSSMVPVAGQRPACTCSPGYRVAAIPRPGLVHGQVDCRPCPVGSYKVEQDVFGRPGQCSRCPSTTTTVALGSASYLDCVCQDNYYNFRNVFIACIEHEWYRLEAGPHMHRIMLAKQSRQHCIPVPGFADDDVQCVTTYANGSIILRPEHWTFAKGEKNVPRSYFSSFADQTIEQYPSLGSQAARPINQTITLQVYRCRHSSSLGTGETCRGGDWREYHEGRGCTEGAFGPTCALCDIGYKRGQASCELCENADVFYLTNVVAIYFVLLVVGGLLFTISQYVYRNASPEQTALGTVLITFSQVLYSLGHTYNIPWPYDFQQFIELFRIFSFDVLGNIECNPGLRWVKSFYIRFICIIVFPAFSIVTVRAYFHAYHDLESDRCVSADRIRTRKQEKEGKEISLLEIKTATIEADGKSMSLIFYMISISYLKLAQSIVEMFRQRKFEPTPAYEWNDELDAADDSDRNRLEADMGVDTSRDVYVFMEVLAGLSFVAYFFVGPMFVLVIAARERGNMGDVKVRAMFGSYLDVYKSSLFLWELWELTRRLLLCCILGFFNRGSITQLLLGMTIAVISFVLHLMYMPYLSDLANLSQLLALAAIWFDMLGGILVKVQYTAGIDTGLGDRFANNVLVFINVCVPAVIATFEAYSWGLRKYQYSIGTAIPPMDPSDPRAALLESIKLRKQYRAEIQKKSRPREGTKTTKLAALWDSTKREEIDGALVEEEQADLDKRGDEYHKARILLRQAELHMHEKREWYRYVYTNTRTEEEFNALVQTESFSSYTRLKLGLEEDMEDDIHERVTREIVQLVGREPDESDEDHCKSSSTSGSMKFVWHCATARPSPLVVASVCAANPQPAPEPAPESDEENDTGDDNDENGATELTQNPLTSGTRHVMPAREEEDEDTYGEV
jgi:hypothetical protein